MKITKQQAKELRGYIEAHSDAVNKFMEGYQELFDGQVGVSDFHPHEIVRIINPPVAKELGYILFECNDGTGWCRRGEEEIANLGKNYKSFERLLDFSGLLREDE